jgi:hypothetical protein
MTVADETMVRGVLAPYETNLFQVVWGAWNEWKALPLAGRLLFPGRTRACIVHDFMVQRAQSAFAADPAVRILLRDETAKFVFANQVLLRFKKADDNGLGANIPTQAAWDFINQRPQLPGFPEAHKVEVLYVLNRLQTEIDRVVVVARDGDLRLWDYAIAPASTADIIQLPLAPAANVESGPRIRVRPTPINNTVADADHGPRIALRSTPPKMTEKDQSERKQTEE